MNYNDEEIKNYLNVLNSYKRGSSGENPPPHRCSRFEEYLGQHLCLDCGKLKGHILGKFDINDTDRLYYQKKSIYHRKYYFEKKVNMMAKLINLTNEEKNELYEKLLLLDCNDIKVINKKFCRKRMININYLIKKILEEMGCEKYKNINLKNNPQILEYYDRWWESYKEIIK